VIESTEDQPQQDEEINQPTASKDESLNESTSKF